MAEQIPDQQGRIVVGVLSDPAAGADWSYIQEVRTRMWLKAVYCKFQTGLAAADRLPELTIDQGGIEVLRIPALQVQTASLIVIYGWSELQALAAVAGQTATNAALPRLLHLNSQAVIGVDTVGKDALDQWTNIRLYFEEWIEPLA